MSYSESSARKPIPTGILVTKASKPAPPDKKLVPRRKDGDERSLPWLYIAVGGSVAWVVAIMTIALVAHSQPTEPAFGPVLANNGVPANPAQPEAFVPPEIDEFQKEPAPRKRGEGAPKLVRHLPPREDAPPELVVFPEDARPAAPAPKQALKKDVDRKAFADCEQIGTNVLFHKDPPAAFQRGREEKKIVFVVHLSGNFEDKEFT